MKNTVPVSTLTKLARRWEERKRYQEQIADVYSKHKKPSQYDLASARACAQIYGVCASLLREVIKRRKR